MLVFSSQLSNLANVAKMSATVKSIFWVYVNVIGDSNSET